MSTVVQDVIAFSRTPVLSSGPVDVEIGDLRPADPRKGYVPAYACRIVRRTDGRDMGSVDLRIGSTDFIERFGGHIGYRIAPEHRGHRYAAHGCLAIRPVALHHGMSTLWITVEPQNVASRRICEILGCSLVETVDLPEDCDMYLRGERQKCRYRWDLG